MKTTEQNQKVNNKVFVMKEMDTKFQALLPKRVDGIFKGAVKVEWHKWDDGFRRMSGPDQEIDRIPAEKCPEALRQSDERYYLNRIKTFLAARPIYDKDGMPVSNEYVTYDVVYNYETEKKSVSNMTLTDTEPLTPGHWMFRALAERDGVKREKETKVIKSVRLTSGLPDRQISLNINGRFNVCPVYVNTHLMGANVIAAQNFSSARFEVSVFSRYVTNGSSNSLNENLGFISRETFEALTPESTLELHIASYAEVEHEVMNR